MRSSKDERRARADFAKRYGSRANDAVLDDIEEAVIGAASPGSIGSARTPRRIVARMLRSHSKPSPPTNA